MAQREIQFVDIPAEVVTQCTGFSLDIGGSVIKLAYRTKEDYEDARKKEEGQTGNIRLVSFSRPELPEAVKYIKDHVYITRDGDSDELTPVFTTGVGCTQYAQLVRDELKCNPNNLMEFDCFTFSMGYLARKLTRDQLLYPLIEEATREPLQMLADTIARFAPLMKSGLSNATFVVNQDAVDKAAETKHPVQLSPNPLAEDEAIYPCLVAVCGSGFAFLKLEENGKFDIVDGSNRGGRAFLGLGSLLTGCKDYDELIALASKGNSDNINVGTKDLLTTDSEADIYSECANDQYNNIIYSFGKSVGCSLADFSREDLAATLLHFMTLDIIQSIFLTAKEQDVKQVFFCGSFINTHTVRSMLTAEFTKRNAFMITMKGQGPGIGFDFVKPGPYLGALGALINTVEKFLGIPSELLAANNAKNTDTSDDKSSTPL